MVFGAVPLFLDTRVPAALLQWIIDLLFFEFKRIVSQPPTSYKLR